MKNLLANRILAVAMAASSTLAAADDLRMNQIQTIATHNSYHVTPDGSPIHPTWGVTMPPLDEQLTLGVRGFELDVYYQPGGTFNVLHVPRFDAGTTCETFVDCLTTIREWSRAHPNHVPIITHIEIKDEQYQAVPETIHPVNGPELDLLDAAVRSVFDGDHLLTPDDVRGEFATLNEAITTAGWPRLDDVRGKVVFILHNRGRHREAFIEKTPTLEGRAMFTMSVTGEPDAAFLLRDNPSRGNLPELVSQGYMLRTRDGGPDNPERKDRAFASGAHLVSTDFPRGNTHEATGYFVEFPGNLMLRCNPVNAPENCSSGQLE